MAALEGKARPGKVEEPAMSDEEAQNPASTARAAASPSRARVQPLRVRVPNRAAAFVCAVGSGVLVGGVVVIFCGRFG